ncbi:MAG: hypothetical protein AVDCRST_MAG75-2543, partial [uncultured Propionibacteriaceae bacterium]
EPRGTEKRHGEDGGGWSAQAGHRRLRALLPRPGGGGDRLHRRGQHRAARVAAAAGGRD